MKNRFIILILTLAVLLLAGCNDSGAAPQWESGITDGIPAFQGELASTDASDSYFTAYYNNVSGEEIDAYVSEIEQACGVSFAGDRYPRSAIYGDKIIAIHYNVTEMRFSVTVTQKTNG